MNSEGLIHVKQSNELTQLLSILMKIGVGVSLPKAMICQVDLREKYYGFYKAANFWILFLLIPVFQKYFKNRKL